MCYFVLSVVGMPLIILSVLGALVLAILIILYLIFRPKCHKRGKAKRNTFMESSARCSGVGTAHNS